VRWQVVVVTVQLSCPAGGLRPVDTPRFSAESGAATDKLGALGHFRRLTAPPVGGCSLVDRPKPRERADRDDPYRAH
jgi:hypothetical protein